MLLIQDDDLLIDDETGCNYKVAGSKYKSNVSRFSFIAYSYKRDAEDKERSKSKGPLFYVLIGASSAALIVFSFLLIYFVIAMRRRRDVVQSKSLDQQYVNMATGNGTQTPEAARNGSLPGQVRVCLTNGKKYSRDKSENHMQQGTTVESTLPKTVVSLQDRTYHNNVYVLSGHRC